MKEDDTMRGVSRRGPAAGFWLSCLCIILQNKEKRKLSSESHVQRTAAHYYRLTLHSRVHSLDKDRERAMKSCSGAGRSLLLLLPPQQSTYEIIRHGEMMGEEDRPRRQKNRHACRQASARGTTRRIGRRRTLRKTR